jgi:hypothetical protein
MIRLVYLLRRREGMDLAEFQRSSREVHGTIVASFATALDVVKYVQVHAIEDPLNEAIRETSGGMEPGYDGVAELSWRSRARPATVKPFTVNHDGFSLNAAVACPTDGRDPLERLCRYVTRPAIALERLSLNRAGRGPARPEAPVPGRHDGPEVHAGGLHGAAGGPGAAAAGATCAVLDGLTRR